MSAVLSEDRVYRYTLTRISHGVFYDTDRTLVVAGVNPSTADEEIDDPTITCLMEVAGREDCNRLIMLNLFAFRATDPKVMKQALDPIGPDNDQWIMDTIKGATLFVAAWGNNGKHLGRDRQVLAMLKSYEVKCFGQNANGSPKHPLYGVYKNPLVTYQDNADA